MHGRYVLFGEAAAKPSPPPQEGIEKPVPAGGAVSITPNALYAVGRLMTHGLPRHAACAIVGHGQQEAYPRLDPTAVGDKGSAHGIMQWRGARLRALEEYAAGMETTRDDLALQCRFIMRELATTESATRLKLAATETVEQAVEAFMGFLRPAGYTPGNPRAGHGFKHRLAYAEALYRATQPEAATSDASDATQEAVDSIARTIIAADALKKANPPLAPLVEPEPKGWSNVMKIFWAVAVATVVLILSVAGAVAAEAVAPNVVLIPWGDVVKAVIDNVTEIVVAGVAVVFAFVLRQVPALLRPLILTARVDQLVENAVRGAMAQVEGAVEGKNLSIEVNSEVVRTALRYVLAHGAPKVIDFAGASIPLLVEKILARMTAHGVVPKEFGLKQAAEIAAAAPRSQAEARAETEGSFGFPPGFRPSGV